MIERIIFCRETNTFTDILTDTTIKPLIETKLLWRNHLMIIIRSDIKEHVLSYINLKYGDDMVTSLVKDFTPIPYVDYVPKKDPKKFKKAADSE